MRSDKLQAALIVTLLTALAGCSTTASGPSKVQTSAKYIVPTPAIIEEPAVRTLQDLLSVTPIVGIFKLVRDSRVRGSVDRVLDAAGLDVAQQMRTQLERELTAASLEVGSQEVQRRGSSAFEFSPDPKELPRGQASQVFLDTSVVYGFIAPTSGDDYRPYVVVELQVRAADTLEVKYRDSFASYYAQPVGGTAGAAPGTPTWKNVAAIRADGAGASAALKDVMAAMAKEIAVQLKADQAVIFPQT